MFDENSDLGGATAGGAQANPGASASGGNKKASGSAPSFTLRAGKDQPKGDLAKQLKKTVGSQVTIRTVHIHVLYRY